MDRRSLLVPGLVLTSLLAGCGSGGDSEAPTPDQAHLSELRAQDPDFDNLADSTIFDLAVRMCSELGEGKTLDEINQGSFGLDLTQEQVPLLFVFAIKSRCPEHGDLLPPTP